MLLKDLNIADKLDVYWQYNITQNILRKGEEKKKGREKGKRKEIEKWSKSCICMLKYGMTTW